MDSYSHLVHIGIKLEETNFPIAHCLHVKTLHSYLSGRACWTEIRRSISKACYRRILPVGVAIWPKHEADQSPANYLEIVVVFPIQFLWVLQSRAVRVQLYNYATVPLCNSSLQISSLNVILNCKFWPEQRNFLFRLPSQTLVKNTVEFRGCDYKIWSVLHLLDSTTATIISTSQIHMERNKPHLLVVGISISYSEGPMFKSEPRDRISLLRLIVVFLRPFRKVLLRYFKLCHSHFVLQPCRFSVYQHLYHSTL